MKDTMARAALLFYGASAWPLDLLDSIGHLSALGPLPSRKLQASCSYGYAKGLNAYGEACAACLAPPDWGNCSDWTDCDGLYQ